MLFIIQACSLFIGIVNNNTIFSECIEMITDIKWGHNNEKALYYGASLPQKSSLKNTPEAREERFLGSPPKEV